MIKDMDGNSINLLENPNGHMLVLGQSGSGKTYFMCRKMEESIKNKKSILVFDYSGSYTRKEFEKNKFCIGNTMMFVNPCELPVKWEFRREGIENVIADVLIRVLPVGSYYQKKLLREAVKRLFDIFGAFNMTQLLEVLEWMLNVKSEVNEQENIRHILTRLEPFSELSEFTIVAVNGDKQVIKCKPIVVVQLSNYAELQKKFLLNFLVELLWEEIKRGINRADILIFDEFQHLNLKEGYAVSALLREGRKYGVSVYAASQFIGKKEKEVEETLMQAGNKIFFHPTESESRDVAYWIDAQRVTQWSRRLGSLDVGQVVVKGCYSIADKSRACKKPIICNVREV